MNVQSIVQRAQCPDFSQLDDNYLAIDAQRGYCYSLNATAARIWDMIDQPTSLAALCDRLQMEYNVDKETCLRDTIALVSMLQASGLLQVGTDGKGEQ
jgi:hypothetical protein